MKDELLKYAIDNDIIDLSYVQDIINMKRRKEYLEKHPFKIWDSDDGYTRTYLPKGNGDRRLIKRRSRKDVEDIVVDYWKNQSDNTFAKRFEIWVNRQQMCGRSPNSIARYWSDYNRFIKDDNIEILDIRSINEEMIADFLRRQLTQKKVPYKTLKGLFSEINGVFNKSMIDKVVDKNPCIYIDLPMFKQLCIEKDNKSSEMRTLSTTERKSLITKLNNKNTIVHFAVEFAMYTGMRVGELSGLMWQDINEKSIVICRSEKYNRLTKEHYISTTKNNKVRTIPLTENMAEVLSKVKEMEIENGWLGEFVFMNQNGRIHASTISDCARNNTMSSDFTSTKSIHAIRRTLNSTMKSNGVPATVAAALLGHTVRVNEDNYTYDVLDISAKYDIMQSAGKVV